MWVFFVIICSMKMLEKEKAKELRKSGFSFSEISSNLKVSKSTASLWTKHVKINQIGVDTQNEVVKEEKRLRVDNQPYGQLIAEVKKNLFKVHPYRWATIGSMEHLDAATLEEFQAFNKKFYSPERV